MAAEKDESARLAALRACAVLDTPREAAFDNIVFTVAQMFRVQAAMLGMVDEARIWAKAVVGPLATERPRDHSFCNQVVETGQMMVIEDASVDARYANLLFLAPDAPVRFFAGAPVLGPGKQPVGALAVFDRHPRSVPERQQMHLMQLAHQAGELLRIRVPNLDLTE